jgi:hypothetical protein
MDLSGCTRVAWDLRIRYGPDQTDYLDQLNLEVWTGEAFEVIWSEPGGLVTTGYLLEAGGTASADVIREDATLRWASVGSGSTVDDFFIDDVTIGCDSDGDDLPNRSEVEVYQTDPTNADTDGDGRRDGRELLVETDPLDPASF